MGNYRMHNPGTLCFMFGHVTPRMEGGFSCEGLVLKFQTRFSEVGVGTLCRQLREKMFLCTFC